MIRILSVFGTRPEAIKMAPLIKKLESHNDIESIVCTTSQHKEMIQSVLDTFNIIPDFDLEIMTPNQTIIDIITKTFSRLDKIIKDVQPQVVLVHGDTTTASTSAQVAFLNKVPVGHVEAGLRTNNKYSPFPEEMNRRIISTIADFHFAPTPKNAHQLNIENIKENVFITGNTVIDALMMVSKTNHVFENEKLNNLDFKNKKICLFTCHRRENLGLPMTNIFSAIKDIVLENDDVEIVFPIHMNPKIRIIANKVFDGVERINLVEPLNYVEFSNLMNRCYLVITDSGGIQEEAPSLGKPVLVVRTETERPEAVEAGTVKIIGVDYDNVKREIEKVLLNQSVYDSMCNATNPYGDGNASTRIIDAIVNSKI